jgi:hypothetical protein
MSSLQLHTEPLGHQLDGSKEKIIVEVIIFIGGDTGELWAGIP